MPVNLHGLNSAMKQSIMGGLIELALDRILMIRNVDCLLIFNF